MWQESDKTGGKPYAVDMAEPTTIRVGVVLLALLAVGPASATAQQGGIAGVVTDDTGGVLPGVTVEASGAPLAGGPRLEVTDGDGAYALAGLSPGTYLVTFTLPGFERLEREIVLEAAATATLDVRLELGGLFEEVTVAVTGTAIEAPAINMPHAVTVVSRDTLEQQGSTQLVDLFRNLSVSHGVVGERNSWYNSNQPATLTENVANVNLRGLGASRTLVLINGRRHVPVPARLIGGRFVDVNTIPAIAIGRLEVLKEGASATYGSDAVGGVANFVTRSDFRGFELNVSHDYFADGGDTTVAGIWGGRIGASNAVFSAERVGRQELQIADRPWALDRLSAYPPGTRGGWSSIGNPGTFAVGGPAPVDGRRLRPAVHRLRRSGRGLDLPLPLRAVRQPDRRAAAHARLRRDQRPHQRPRQLPHRGPLVRRQDPELVHHAVVPALPPDEHHHHGGGGRSSGPAGVLRRLRRRREGRPDERVRERRPLVLQRPPVRELGSGPPAEPVPPAPSGSPPRSTATSAPAERAHWDVGLSYSRARGNLNLPAVYTDRIFRAFRGFGGPNCGVGVVADRSSPAGMRLGERNGAVAGQGRLPVLQPVQQRHPPLRPAGLAALQRGQPGLHRRPGELPRRCGSG